MVIRFKGGSGGEFMRSLLEPDDHRYHGNLNRITHNSRFNCLLNHAIDHDICDRYALPRGSAWENLPRIKAERIVSQMLSEHPEDVICMHMVFMRNLDHSRVFNGYDFIDLYPSVGCYWMTQALQIYKAAFSRTDGTVPPCHPQDGRYQHAVRFKRDNGWYPAWWGWVLREGADIGLDDPAAFLEWAVSAEDWEQRLSNTRLDGITMTIPAERFIVDIGGVQIARIVDALGMGIDDNDMARMREWASRNIQILHRIGAADHIGLEMEAAHQKSLLMDLFLPIYDDLMETG